MKNYGEELVYWYLRLNGFFLLENFVLHMRRGYREGTSDTDLLAVRFPYVYEEIGGQKSDWDFNFFDKFDSDKIIGLICEVKTTSHYKPNEILKDHNIEKAIKRFGFTNNISKYLNQIKNCKITTFEKYQVSKLVVSPKSNFNREDLIHLKLSYVNSFILNKMKKYID